jgi:NodT family efflux transporter outer membrane factor (OMF) lipoprotein
MRRNQPHSPWRLARDQRWSILCIIAFSVALTGCVTPKEIAPIRDPTSYETKESFAVPTKDWPSDRWWTGFGDTQLDNLIEEGLENAPSLQIAAARFAHAEALVGEARSRLLPSIDASSQIGGQKSSYNYLIPKATVTANSRERPAEWDDYAQGSMGISWELDFWGRNRSALATARSVAEASRAEAAQVRLELSTGIAAAYAGLAALYAEADAADNAVSVRTQTFHLMDQRYHQALENVSAVERAKSALAAAQAEQKRLSEEIDLNHNRLAALLGAGPDRGREIVRPSGILSRPFGLPEHLPANLIGRRPDIVAARSRAGAAASQVKVAKADFYPNIDLIGLIGVESLGVSNLFRSGSGYGLGGAAISLPIFTGGRLESQYRASEADYKEAVSEYNDVLTEALREVADVLASQRALVDRLQYSRDSERSATDAWGVANDRYKGGLATYLDVLTAEDALIAARRTVAVLSARAFSLDVALIRALGGGYRS